MNSNTIGGGHRLVVTGASGTLGRNIIAEVLGWNQVAVLALVRAHSKTVPMPPNVIIREVDFDDRSQVESVLRQFNPTCVVHCAASGMQFRRPAWFEMVRFNVDVSLNLCESVSRIPGCRFIFISTGLAYRDQGRPLREDDALDTQHPYGASKAAADILIRSAAAEFGVPLTVFRPFSFSGLGDNTSRLFPSLLRAAAAREPFHMTSGDQVRDHCAVTDIAHGVSRSILMDAWAGEGGRVFNLGSGRNLPLRALVEGVAAELELPVELHFGERLLNKFEPKHLVADTSRAQAELGWSPRVNFAYAVWQLAHESFPNLKLKQPIKWLNPAPQS
jgi:nucleoside-diphosphate-sugar epimerase